MCTQHGQAQKAVDRWRLVQPAKRHIRRHISVVLLHGPKSAPLRRVGDSLTHSCVLEYEHVWIERSDRLDTGAERCPAGRRSQHTPTKQRKNLFGARAGAPNQAVWPAAVVNTWHLALRHRNRSKNRFSFGCRCIPMERRSQGEGRAWLSERVRITMKSAGVAE